MNLNNKGQIIIIGAGLLIIAIFVLGFMGVIPGFKKSTGNDPNYPTGKIDLTVWGVGDPINAYSNIFKTYQDAHKNVRLSYVNFVSLDEYERELVNAFAEGRGPDIFMIDNTWLPEHVGKMSPAPITWLTPQMMAQLYPAVVTSDFVYQGSVYALPLNMDTLELFYNKDIFNAKGVIYPPTTWDDVLTVVPQTRTIGSDKKIQTAAIALGGARNVEYLSDILSALMLQGGSSINTPDGAGVRFDAAAQQALVFYLQFSNPINPSYTWNESFENSRQAFASGKAAMILDYREAEQDISQKNPFLNFDVAALPQLSPDKPALQTTFAHYSGLAVSRQASAADAYVAWDFLRWMNTTPGVVSLYLDQTKKFPALRSMIKEKLGTDDDVFARGALIAKTWKEANSNEISTIFKNMVSDIISGRVDVQRALRAAEEEITALYR